MKRRITLEDLGKLTQSQKENLRKIWIPKRYDLSTAYMCINVETDEYIEIEFCIGKVVVKPNGTIILYDLRAADGFAKLSDIYDKENIAGEPTAFNKGDCLPLLSISEMIEIMDKLSFKNFHFYLLAGTGKIGCEVGNFNSTIKTQLLNSQYRKEDLCNVLWDMIVRQL